MFDIPVSFYVDLSELTSRYLKLQKVLHPDKFASNTEQQKLYSVQQTAELNNAYETLKNPLLRARYLMGLNGIVLDDEQNTIMDSRFLMQQMELREALNTAKTENASSDAVESILDQIDELSNTQFQNLKKQFALAQPDYEAVADSVRKLQFFSKLHDEADTLLAQIEDK